MAVIKLEKVMLHNLNVMAGKTGVEKMTDIRDTYEKHFEQFTKQLFDARNGLAEDKHGQRIAPNDVSMDAALLGQFGVNFNTFLRQIEVFGQTHTLGNIGARFGYASMNVGTLTKMLMQHTSFSTPNSTQDIPKDFRFIIPEIIINAIRIGYETSGMANNWIATTQNIADEEITMPQIHRSDSMPYKVGEGGKFPVGKVKFGKKKAGVFKIGTALELTDELIARSSIDLLAQYMQDVGIDMAIGDDTYAMDILVNGEQADASESAPVIGVETVNAFGWRDIKRVSTRMRRLRNVPERLLSTEDEAIDISGIDKYEGFSGETKLASFRSIVGVPDVLDNDVQVLPTDQILYLAPKRAMARLNYRGMLVEEERDITTQKTITVISKFVGYTIIRRDARVLQDKSVQWVKNTSTDFPAYMDIDARIAGAFQS